MRLKREPRLPRFDASQQILASVALGWFFALGLRIVLPVLLPYIRAEYDLTLAIGGSLMSLMFLCYAFGQFPGGILGDLYGERNILVVSMGLVTVGVFAISVSRSFWGMIGGIVLLSFGAGMFAPTRFTILSDVFANREGAAHGISFAAGDLGNTLLPVVAGLLAGAFFWRLGIGFAIPFLVATVLLLWMTVPRTTSGEPIRISPEVLRRVGKEVVKPTVVLATVLLLIASIIFQGHSGLYPSYLVAEKGLSEEVASVILGLFFACSILVHLISGTGVDRYGTKRVIAVMLLVGAAGFETMPIAYSLPEIVAVTVLSSASIGAMTALMPYLIDELSSEIQGTTLGILRTVYIAVASGAPFVIGTLGEIGSFDLGFQLLGVTALIAAGLSSLLPSGD